MRLDQHTEIGQPAGSAVVVEDAGPSSGPPGRIWRWRTYLGPQGKIGRVVDQGDGWRRYSA